MSRMLMLNNSRVESFPLNICASLYRHWAYEKAISRLFVMILLSDDQGVVTNRALLYNPDLVIFDYLGLVFIN